MLPWLTIYENTNYARWGPVYLADMRRLETTAPEVYAEFMNGNFVVKRTRRCFNQVSADQSTGWVNRTCKIQNGIIGITRKDQARDKFCITWSERSRISQDTRYLFSLEDDEEETPLTRSDNLASHTKRDDDVKKLAKQLERFNVFRLHSTLNEEGGEDESEERSVPLVSLATKDIAPFDVVTGLLTAEDRGKQHLIANVKQRLIDGSVQFHAALRRHHSKTFADMYKVAISTQQCVQKYIKADRKLLQRLLNAVTAGRSVEMESILKHELSPVPLSLAKPGGQMN